MYIEVALLIMQLEAVQNPAFQLGRVVIPFTYIVFQAFLLWKIVQLRNWARITLAIVVLLNTLLAFAFLVGPFSLMPWGAVAQLAQVATEVLAVILLFISNSFAGECPRAV